MLDHFFLTRFNLPSGGAEQRIRAQEGWLRNRVELFETYCLPSVRQQSVKDFGWIVFFDVQSPAWLQQRVQGWSDEGLLTPVYGEEFTQEQLTDPMRALARHPTGALLTTNLDNDDGLASDFVERVQAAVRGLERPSAVYLTRGLIRNADALYLQRDPDNAFCSVVSDWTDPVLCWSHWHNRLHEIMPVERLDGEPGWLQVVHGRNVSNRVRGRIVSPERYQPLLPGLVDDLPVPSAASVTFERLGRRPVRVARDAMRRGFKAAILAVGGTAALDRISELRATVRRR